MLNRNRVLLAFRQALNVLKEEAGGREIRPRRVALRAHALYCAGLAPEERPPAADTFRKLSAGPAASPAVIALLSEAGIRPGSLARIDRERLRSVFEEAIRRLESRLLKGQARPGQIVRRAYELYTRDTTDKAPSRGTFENLIYGKSADPELSSLVQTALRKKDGAKP